MAVYARGYRPYESTFRGMSPAFTIAGEGIRMALKRKGVRRIFIFLTLCFCVMAGILYFQFGLQEQVNKVTDQMGLSPQQILNLNRSIRGFHNLSVLLTSLAAILVGAGLVADDLRTRALSLYLVRPLRPIDYMFGKALILPGMLIPLALLPGLMFFLLVALWQPPGQTWSFIAEHKDIAFRVLKFYVLGATSLTGLMLVLSSRTPRRGVVMGLAAAVIFGGAFLREIGVHLTGSVGGLLRASDVMNNMGREFKLAGPIRIERAMQRHPTAEAVWIVALGLLVAGLILTWRRARTVEMGE